MKLINNRWVDDNNNSWRKEIYTEEQAEAYSKTLKNCSYCSGCLYCSDCSGCSRCSDCSYCSDCSGCSYCSDCSGCSRCSGCSGCSYCSYCSYCSGCSDCSDCSYCSDCSGCSRCSRCSYCSGCKIQPEIYSTARIGSRNSNTIFFKTEDVINVACGCFRGTFAEWVARVRTTYPDKDNQYRKQYEAEIKKVKKLWGVK